MREVVHLRQGASVPCFGQGEGLPMGEAFALLADDDGGFWIGGQRQLVHWREGARPSTPSKP